MRGKPQGGRGTGGKGSAALLSLTLLTAIASSASAQACKIDSNADWVKRQAQWFDESKHDWKDDTLRTQLLAAAGLTAPLKMPAQIGVHVEARNPKLGATAGEMTQRLKAIAAARGSAWPGKLLVGPAGMHAVFLLAQQDSGLARVALHRLMEAGPDESLAADVATLEDQFRLAQQGRKQLDGTQFRMDANGKVVLAPMEDSAHADLRREDSGLPPFKLGLCLAREVK